MINEFDDDLKQSLTRFSPEKLNRILVSEEESIAKSLNDKTVVDPVAKSLTCKAGGLRNNTLSQSVNEVSSQSFKDNK